MKQEDIILGAKVYIATIVEFPTKGVPSRVIVDDFVVTKAGKTRFEIVGRGRRGGYYDNNGFTIASMQLTPAAAVNWLEQHRKKDVEHAKRSLERAEQMLLEDLKSIQEWRNSHGL